MPNLADLCTNADIYYNEPKNILIINPVNQEKEATFYRPPDGINKFSEKFYKAQEVENREIPLSVTTCN